MKIKLKHTTCDYREALEFATKYSTLGDTITTYHKETNDFIIECIAEVTSHVEHMRKLLTIIKVEHDLTPEELDALAFADSAIKTLVDMGVIE